MNREELAPPYDFSNWELGEDTLSNVEVAVWELLDEAQDKTMRHNWPDFKKLNEAVIRVVREQLAYAFNEHRSGKWHIDSLEEPALRWISEVDGSGNQTTFILKPRQLIPLLIAPLAENLSKLPIADYSEPPPQYYSDHDFDWDKNWLLAFAAAKQWHRAILASLKGLKSLQLERQDILAEEARRDAASACEGDT
jgi:hypothetical protein